MNNYSQVKSENCYNLECLANSYNLFALFDAPANIIFADQFINNIKKYKDIFNRYFANENIFFSCKCNKSYALLKYAAQQKCGIEVSSYYELKDALKYSNNIIASGPAKDKKYLRKALDNNVIISVDDIEELRLISKTEKNARVLLRISDIIGIVSRFGINYSQLDECFKIIKKSKIKFLGFSFHINNYSLEDRIKAIKEIVEYADNNSINIKYIDIGGGIPTNYCSKKEYENFIKNNNDNMYFKKHFIQDYYPYYSDVADEKALDYIFKNVYKILNDGNIQIIIEPGRCLLKDVGVSIYEVQYIKHLSNGDNLIVTNGNINCLSEQWFSSDYLIEPLLIVKENRPKTEILASVAGNLCLEQDMVTWRKIQFDMMPKRGDYLVYFNTAGYQMDSNESTFHKIPLVKKYIVEDLEGKCTIKEDKKYDC